MGSKVKVQPGRTFSSTAPTLVGGAAPSTSPSAVAGPSNRNEVQDVYDAALVQLRQKIPSAVSQAEFDAFLAAGGSPSCTTDTQARDLLESIRSDAKYHRGFHKFFNAVHTLLEPLRLLKSALDTFCQVEPVFCYVWGSVKVLIEIAKEVSQVPAMVSQGIAHLVGYFPAYQQYYKCLLIPTVEGLPLRTPLINIYVEYLTFCILARRLAKSSLGKYIPNLTLSAPQLLKYEAVYRKCYPTQLFLSAPSKKRFLDSVQKVLETLELPQREKPDPSAKILGLHNWLLQSRNWLLLIDNIAHESVDLILQLLASGAPGHVILTSQALGAVERITRSPKLCLSLQEPTLDEAVEIFVNAAGVAPNEESKRVGADIILDWDDDGTRASLCADDTRRHAISRPFRLIFGSLETSHPDALAVLRFFSLLEAESIPLYDEWHRADWTPGFQVANQQAEQPQQLSRTSTAPRKAKTRSPGRLPGQRLLWMHDLTKKTTRAMIPPHEVKTWVGAALNVVYHMMPVEDSTAEERGWVDTCLPSAMGLLRQVEALGFETSEYACFLALCALCNLRHDAWGLSQKQFEAALPEYVKYLGLEHRRTLTLMHQHAWAVRNDGKVGAAEAILRRTWELRSRALGRNAPETLAALNDLASTIERAGRLQEAEAMFKTLYEGYRDSRGTQSQEALAAGHNYAVCFHNQGRLREAGDVYRAVLDTSIIELGSHDEGTLKTMANYAATLDHDGRSDEASAMYDRALSGYKDVLGFDHLLTLRLRVNMASLLKQRGRFDEAEIMLGKCLERAIFLWGLEGMETMAYLYDLGEVWQAKGDLPKARDVFKKLADGLTGDIMGHPLVPRWIDSWATAEREMGHLTPALEKSREGYDRFEKLLGWYDPYTLVAANDYAEALQAVGQYTQAWDLYARCRDSFATLVGKDHPHYAMALNNMGRCCWALNNRKQQAKAESFFVEAREVLKTRVGATHFCTLTVSLNLARAKAATGNIQGAIALAEETRDALEAAVGRSHPLVSAAHLVLGAMIASRGDGASLLAAADHLRAAVTTARDGQYTTASANYYLSIALLALLLRRTKSNVSAVAPLVKQLRGPGGAGELSPFDIPGVGRFTAVQLAEFDPPESFDFRTYIPLFTGETVKLRWGRKTCWREAGKTTLHC
ncbi:hypothetical protein C8A00DRAFT_12868 [Chaetomidium leptoderma]|uniref:TPR-like protein n=1 Tax=Chaetomidium leptoderma TaxID=669021 RepID=A0AAN6VQZ1_9PEZI|nr:hypothetical protein C8A00DRAFT_12868 [Chaetomidium leptoderma]